MNWGMRVDVVLESCEKVTLRNITEIHYRYPSVIKESMSVAFESDIHYTGCTYYISDIKEFHTELETERQEEV